MPKVSCPPPSIAVLWANITLRRVHATWLGVMVTLSYGWLVPALCGGVWANWGFSRFAWGSGIGTHEFPAEVLEVPKRSGMIVLNILSLLDLTT